VHRGRDAVYLDLDGWCLGVVGTRATAVPCALRTGADRSDDFIAKMRDRGLRCFAALDKQMSSFDEIFDLARITTAVACGYDEWRYGPGWREAAPTLAAWYDTVAQRPSMKSTEPAETPQR